MPSLKSRTKQTQPSDNSGAHSFFFPFLIFCLGLWLCYRFLFNFPVWFDETLGKAIFFGLPVIGYVQLTRAKSVVSTFAGDKFHPGLLSGIAIGGLFGFMASLLGVFQAGGVQSVALFSSPEFWWQFFLAVMTGFWETLFFFCWVMIILQEKFPSWSLAKQVLWVSSIFLLFHLPNIFLRFSGMAVVAQIVLLFLFALGQALFFVNRRNGYALVLSHAIWGMVLLVHLG